MKEIIDMLMENLPMAKIGKLVIIIFVIAIIIIGLIKVIYYIVQKFKKKES